MDSFQHLIVNLTQEVLTKAGFVVSVEYRDGIIPCVHIASEYDLAILIGAHGQHLEALEHLIRIMAFRQSAPGQRLPDFILDVNEYRKTKMDNLMASLTTAIDHVRSSGRSEALPPMTAHERKIIHTHLSPHKDLISESIGSEPNRRVVIKLVHV